MTWIKDNDMRNCKLNHYVLSVIVNILMAYLCYCVCRLVFILENHNIIPIELTSDTIGNYLMGGFIFDSSAICFTNCIYLAIVLVPVHYLWSNRYAGIIAKWAFILPNSLAIIANLCDSVYFSFTHKRVTASVFGEFQNENNLFSIISTELFSHWYLLLLALCLIVFIVKCYQDAFTKGNSKNLRHFYVAHSIVFIVFGMFTVFGIRGEVSFAQTRPITISNALQYVSRPVETNIILNTPFSIIKTLRNKKLPIGTYYSQKELHAIYNPIHYPSDSATTNKKNIVILIVESLAEEFIGERNKALDNGKYRGYTPFVDSLLRHSLTFENTFCNT